MSTKHSLRIGHWSKLQKNKSGWLDYFSPYLLFSLAKIKTITFQKSTKLGKGRSLQCCLGAQRAWTSQRPQRLTGIGPSHAANPAPCAVPGPWGCWPNVGRMNSCLQEECSHTMGVELLYQLLGGEGRAFASGCILRLYLSLPIVILCSVIHPHAGLLRCEDWRQRCWPNSDRPLWKGCAQDRGQFCRTRNGGGMSQFWIPYMCMEGGFLSFKPSIKMSSRKMSVDQAGPMNPRHSYNIFLQNVNSSGARCPQGHFLEGKQSVCENADCCHSLIHINTLLPRLIHFFILGPSMIHFY